MTDEQTLPTNPDDPGDHATDASPPRPEGLIRTPESDSSPDEPGDAEDEDLTLRVDTQEWQEYPSPNADPPPPESVAERMTAADEPADTDQDA